MPTYRTRDQEHGRTASPLTAADKPLDEGNDVGIDPADTCINDGCEHPAGDHTDAPLGDHMGACGTEGCTCSALQVAGDPLATSDSGGDGAAGGLVDGGDVADGTAGGDAPEMAAPAVAVTANAITETVGFSLTDWRAAFDDALAPGEMEGPPFFVPVAVIEGVETGDGRMIAPGALSWYDPPLPLMGLKTSAHDPSGMSVNDPAVIIGRCDFIRRSEDNPNVLQAGGVLLTTEHGMEWAEIIDQMGRVGVSVDVGDVESQIAISDVGGDEMLGDEDILETLTKGSVMGITCCAFPAFPGAYIVLGTEAPAEAPEMAPTPEGAQMAIRVAHAEPCEPCTSGTIVAAAGPLRPPTAWFQDPGFHDGDPRLVPLVDQRTGKPNGRYGCPLTITEDGQVYGHLAEWGVCHTGPQYRGKCITPPRSKTGYAVFHGGGSVLTAEGTLVDVGPLTVDGPHVSSETRYHDPQAALRRYDDTTTRGANVRAGEDEYGIWVAGAVHPDATDAQVYTLRSSHLSGDWRPWGSSQELIAGHAVNTPGFPTAKATLRDGRVTSLVAAGVPCFAPERTEADRFAALEAVVLPPVRDKLRGEMAAMLRSEMAALVEG